MELLKKIRFPAVVIFVNCLVPLVLMLWDVYHQKVGANPLEFVTRTTGMLTLVFLFIVLAITPIRVITGQNALVKFRRILGLFAFFYGSVHLLTYIWFDRSFNLRNTAGDIAQRPFIAVGLFALILMLPLAITSTNRMVKRLGGKTWRRLHRLAYLAGVAGVIHYWMLVKSDTRLPLTFAFVLLLLLGHRLFVKYFPPESRLPGTTIVPRD